MASLSGSLGAQERPESRFFDSAGVPIHYLEAGSGEAVVLLHGNTDSVERWLDTGIFQALAEDHHVIAFDARGHGKSGKPHDASAYGEEMARDIVRLMDHLGVEQAHVLGYSMGARVMGPTMVLHPERFRSAILGGFTPVWNWSAEDQRVVEERHANLLARPSRRLIAEGQDVQALATALLGFSELAVTDSALAAVSVPTLVLIGSEDPNLPQVEALRRLMPDVEVVVIEGATHSGPSGAFYRPEFLAEIRSFIDEHAVGEGGG